MDKSLENLKCPDCGGPMVSRLNKLKNNRFWGCKMFPDCRGTRDVNGLSRQDRENQKNIELERDLDLETDQPIWKRRYD